MAVIPENSVICLMGPTASGKTELAVELVQALPCDIISVDSALVYREMDIGTAKPGSDVLEIAPHRLIDICDPTETYSAARFRADALREMEKIFAKGRTPLLVGGTMLYYRALQYGLSKLPEADPAVRAQLEAEAARVGWKQMHQRLVQIDPVASARIHPNDPQRVQRALEVFELTGQTLTELQNRDGEQTLPYNLIKLARAPKDRTVLHQRIAKRFRQMLELGFEYEVKRLLARADITPNLPSMRSVGYRQMSAYLAGQYSYEQMVERGIIATRQLAKRQLTWLRSEQDIHWLDDEVGNLCSQALKYFKSVST